MAGKTTACPKCRTQLDITGFKPGQRIRCGACNTVLRIPGGEPAVAPVSAPAAPQQGRAPSTQKISLSPPGELPPNLPTNLGATIVSPPPPKPPPRQAPKPAPLPPPEEASEEKKDALIGSVVAGEYEIVKKLGEGGYGVVYEAVERTLHRRVALKLMLANRASNKEYVGKFLREAQTAAKIQHPNIVAIHAVGYEPNLKTHFLGMEFVEGTTLHDILQQRGPLDVEECVDIISQCCRGLGVAHRMNIIHRDIKPGNIMITPNKSVKIADFGLAKQLDAEEQAKSMVIGTPFFMPPEQFEGKSKDGRTDIYALGVTFYYMLTMKRPFTGSTPAQILVGIMTKDPTPIMDVRPGLPDNVWQVVRRMIHRDLEQRYQDCDQILEDLAKLHKPEEGEKTFCPECGVPNPVDAAKCKGCGASMREKCPVCGAEEDVGVKFCGDCGANIPLEKEVKGMTDEGRRLLDAGDYPKAIAKLKEAQEKSPDSSQVVSLLREAEGRRDTLDKERSAVSALIAAGDFDRAGQRLKAALESFPGEEHLVALQGDLEKTRAAMRRGQGKFTVEALLKGHRYAEAREAAERLMMAEGRTDELIDLLRQAEQALHAVAERTKKAKETETAGDPSGAFRAWKEVLDLSPGNSEALERVKAHEESKGVVAALLQEATVALDAGDPEAAEKILRTATGRAAADAKVKELLAKARSGAEELRGAAAAVRKAVEAGDLDAASSAVAALKDKYPKTALVPALEEEIREGRRAAAIRAKEEKVEALLPTRRWAEIRDAAAEVLSDEPRNKAATAASEKAKAELARVAELLKKAAAAEQAGDLAGAESSFLEAAEASPADAEAPAGAARVKAARERIDGLRKQAEEAKKAGDEGKAAEILRQLVEVAPGDAAAAEELKKIERAAADRMRDLREVQDLLAAGEADDALKAAKAFGKKYPGDPEGQELSAIGEHLMGARNTLLARVERLLGTPGREREAARLAQVALRILPGDPKAAALLAKARSPGSDSA